MTADNPRTRAEIPVSGGKDYCNKRNARRQRLSRHLHTAGPRPVLEALIAAESGQPLDDVLEGYARIPSSFFSILGASSLPGYAPSLRGLVHDIRREED